MKQLLLISSSRVHGSGPLEHCLHAIEQHLRDKHRLLFIPYALANYDQYAQLISEALEPIGIQVDSIHQSSDPVSAVVDAEAIYIGGGNTFRLLKQLYDQDLLKPIRMAVEQGVPYMGSSAGTNVACPAIRTTNDMPIVQPPSFHALNLIPFQINPHFVDADPNSTHKGETREQRLAEYLEENEVPVVGIREGSWIHVHADQVRLKGQSGAVWFSRGMTPVELAPEADLTPICQGCL